MNPTEIIVLTTAIVLILRNATQIPHALADLLRACQPVVHAARELAAAIENPSTAPTDDKADLSSIGPQLDHVRAGDSCRRAIEQ